jgi:rubredoxin
MWKRLPNDPHCSACSVEMDLIVDVPPIGTPYGLKVYACPECGASKDLLPSQPSKAA